MSAAVVASRASVIIPRVLVVGGAVGGVVSYVHTQLQKESRALDRSFAQYKSIESEASRRRTFDGAKEDPRTSIFNILSW